MSAGPSRARVTARLTQLQDTYDGFDVRQTTVSVGSAEFERAVEASGGVARANVRIRDSEGRYLLVRDGDEWVDPGCELTTGQSIVETACESVERQTGVTPVVGDLERVSIVCVNCDDAGDRPSDDPLYQLHALFDARPASGSPNEDAEWRTEPPEDPF